MKDSKVITNYDNYPDAGLSALALQMIEALSKNTNFVFTKSELVNLIADQADYGSRLSENPLGGIMETEYKNQSKAKLAKSLHTICTEINLQQKGNTTALESSGAPLVKDSSNDNGSITVTPKELKALAGTEATELDVSVKRNPLIHDHGTMIAYTCRCKSLVNEVLYMSPSDFNRFEKRH